MIGIDTFSWSKLLLLRDEGWEDLIHEILRKGTFFITHEVRKELEYRFPYEKKIFEYVTILPTLDIEFQNYLIRGYDSADASLLEYASKKGYRIITEDVLMLMDCVVEKQNVIQLADFFGTLLKQGFISSRELYQLIKKLRKMKNITKRKEKELMSLKFSIK